ncbi:hypothetical protein [Bradyrhizobium sediminis]|uniref:hypothetical protein n=1 Tax=Bradyrhizobium sediminis TaxID=2840469 RepID=UPI00201BAC36|nr:hypothetical protein [Bradyrhizobium sediminis]
MPRCAGTPTSTFGGGGGTKLFCSQALNVTSANSAKAARQAPVTLCHRPSFGLVHVGERAGIIRGPQFVFFPKRFWFGSRPTINSNNALAAEPETENDNAAFEIFSVTLLSPLYWISLRLRRRLERHDKDFFK